MNTVSTTMTLTDADETVVEHDDTSVVSGQRTYVFNNLSAGGYTISGYNASGALNGTLGITVGSEDLTLQIWTITKICATNQNGGIDWVYGTDYTIEQLEVHSREGDIYPVSMGMNAGYPSCLVCDGGSVILRGNRNLWTLLHLRYTKHVMAEDGTNGQGNQCFGKNGKTAYQDGRLWKWR